MGTKYKPKLLQQTQTLGFSDLSVNKRKKSVWQKLNRSTPKVLSPYIFVSLGNEPGALIVKATYCFLYLFYIFSDFIIKAKVGLKI